MAINLLLFGARRRIYFLKKLRELQPSFENFQIIYTDTDNLDPMCHLCDDFFILPPIPSLHDKQTSSVFWKQLELYCVKHEIKAIMAWNDKDILFLSKNITFLDKLGIKLCLPPPFYVELFCNKMKMAQWCNENKINHPRLYVPAFLDKLNTTQFPIITKPIYGQGSLGVKIIDTKDDINPFIPENLYQEYIHGEEYTVDIWLNESHETILIAPRKRIKTRGGEVLIAKLELDSSVIDFCQYVSSFLKFEGVFNIQVIKTDKEIFLIEINPRIGGGTDLTIEAGGNIPLLLMNSLHGRKLPSFIPQLKDGLIMSRYLENVFIQDLIPYA